MKTRWLVTLSALGGAIAYALLPPSIQIAIRSLPSKLKSQCPHDSLDENHRCKRCGYQGGGKQP